MKKLLFIVLVVLALIIGLYPLMYAFVESKHTFLKTKLPELLNDPIWKFAFLSHISFGALALFIGWRQFGDSFRSKNLSLHRIIGKIYITSVLISSITAIYIGYFANGGIISALGFMSLGFIWLTVTLLAWFKIKRGNIVAHQILMVYSYSCTFAAVTLRLWYPLLNSITAGSDKSYLIVAWLCWIPNLLAAYLINRKRTL